MTDYEFTSSITEEVMDILLSMERDVCYALRNYADIKEGMFKTGTYLGRARSDIYRLLKAEEDKSNEAMEAREARKCVAHNTESESER